MKQAEVLQCQIQEWYPQFRKCSIKTIIHILPESYVDFLLQDGLFLSRSSEAIPTRTKVTFPQLQSEDYNHWEEEDDNGDEPEVPTFPELEEEVTATIRNLGGLVFPKLNWSAPKDTAWISTTGSLKCTNFGEITLLLKASDNVMHDLCHAFDSCDDKLTDRPEVIVLALRKWYDLRPEMEFRAFVRGRILVGICQREVTGFYPALQGREHELQSAISDFFCRNVRSQFGAEDFAFDCYVTKDMRVKLLDFNPWMGSTLSLLFSWDELEEKFQKLLAECAENGHDDTYTIHATGDGNEDIHYETQDREGEWDQATVGIEEQFSSLLRNGKLTTQVEFEPQIIPRMVSRDEIYRAEVRIVRSEGAVQPGLRIGTGIPFDFVSKGNWEEFVERETRDQLRDETAAGA